MMHFSLENASAKVWQSHCPSCSRFLVGLGLTHAAKYVQAGQCTRVDLRKWCSLQVRWFHAATLYAQVVSTRHETSCTIPVSNRGNVHNMFTFPLICWDLCDSTLCVTCRKGTSMNLSCTVLPVVSHSYKDILRSQFMPTCISKWLCQRGQRWAGWARYR